jgi:hypothetical protein
MNQRLITVREHDNRALADVEGMRQERTAEVAALRAEVARLRKLVVELRGWVALSEDERHAIDQMILMAP